MHRGVYACTSVETHGIDIGSPKKKIVMNKSVYSAVLLLLFRWALAPAQNMVVNSTFEGKCVHRGYAQIGKANGWSDANGGTADLFDHNKAKCKHAPNGTPSNYMGYQTPVGGTNYAGIVAFYDDGAPSGDAPSRPGEGYKRYSEYLQGEFREPLVAGAVYQVSFRVSLADKSGRAVSCIGALLSKEQVNQKNNSFLMQTPQFISHRVLSDTANWLVLSGAYIASGGEKYITIGCFKDELFEVVKVVGPAQNDSRKAYYYISDVSVSPYGSVTPSLDALVLGIDYVELMSVLFDTGSSQIKPGSGAELDEVAAWMTRYPDQHFFIAGYTDAQGGDAVNDALSRERASSVKQYLMSKGVNADHLATEGFGSANPVEFKYRSHLNRRVEIYLLNVNSVSTL